VRGRLSYGLESLFPNLAAVGYTVTSCREGKYNCVAWAAKEDTCLWWEPIMEPGCFWPEELPMDYAFENYVKVFELLGYHRCIDSSARSGYEKVAVYRCGDGSFGHVARQVPSGAWTSKLGPHEDIEHSTLSALDSDHYGIPAVYLERRISIWRKLTKLARSILSRLRP
jgi:hypothetical protein